MTSAHRAALAKAFVEEMQSRGVERIDDEAVRYHLALLLRPEGHPTIKVSDSMSDVAHDVQQADSGQLASDACRLCGSTVAEMMTGGVCFDAHACKQRQRASDALPELPSFGACPEEGDAQRTNEACPHEPSKVDGYALDGFDHDETNYLRWCMECGSINDGDGWWPPRHRSETASAPTVEETVQRIVKWLRELPPAWRADVGLNATEEIADMIECGGWAWERSETGSNASGPIKERVVVSEPGAAVTVTECRLTDEAKNALNIGKAKLR